jgi:hypothetical protein
MATDILYDVTTNSQIREYFNYKMIERIYVTCRAKIGLDFMTKLVEESTEFNGRKDLVRVCVSQFFDGDLSGVAIMDIKKVKKKKTKIVLHLLCTLGHSIRLGEKLLNYILDNICGKCLIELESVPSARGFYEKMGFTLKPGSSYVYILNK